MAMVVGVSHNASHRHYSYSWYVEYRLIRVPSRAGIGYRLPLRRNYSELMVEVVRLFNLIRSIVDEAWRAEPMGRMDCRRRQVFA